MTTARWAIAALVLSSLVSVRAAAHGRPAILASLAFDPANADHVVAIATWGVVRSRDGGATWTWQCADPMGFRTASTTPEMAFARDGELLIGLFDGLVRSESSGCDWPDPIAEIGERYVIDLATHPDGSIWALTSPGREPDAVWRSGDGGATFARVGDLPMGPFHDRLRIAPSDATRVYVSGVIPAAGMIARQGVLHRSDDGGRTFTGLPFELLENERTLHVLGVDPTNGDRLFVRVVAAPTPEASERVVRSDDGGMTWETVLTVESVAGLAVDVDGARVWVGDYGGGLFRSDDGGRTFAEIDATLPVRCVSARAGELWVCADGRFHPWAIARSTDGGDTLEPRLVFAEMQNETGCDVTTDVGGICEMYWPDVQYDLGLTTLSPDEDAAVGVDGGMTRDGGSSTPAPRPGCGCLVPGARPGRVAIGVAVLAIAIARRRRSR